MREIRQSGSEGGESQLNASSLPLSENSGDEGDVALAVGGDILASTG